MESLYIGIAIIVLVIIVVLLLALRKKGKQLRKPSNLATVGMVFVVFGIIFIDLGRIPSYSLIGVGALLSIIDGIRILKNKFLWQLLPWLTLALGVGSLGLGVYRMEEHPWAMGREADWTIFFLWLALPLISIGVFFILRTLFPLKLRLAIAIAFAVLGLLLPIIGIMVLAFSMRWHVPHLYLLGQEEVAK